MDDIIDSIRVEVNGNLGLFSDPYSQCTIKVSWRTSLLDIQEIWDITFTRKGRGITKDVIVKSKKETVYLRAETNHFLLPIVIQT